MYLNGFGYISRARYNLYFLAILVRNGSNRIIQNHIEKLRLKIDLIQ